MMYVTHGNLPRRAGFSVIELIVTIGAIALITVGVAQIFQTVGETVTGGRRVSGFTQAAATLESQMRLDVESLTRDGFMVIHHQRTAGNISLAPGAANAVQRRIDELMFYARGEFTTSRPMVSPGLDLPDRIASANEARIYYGHGTRDDFDSEGRDAYLFPTPFDGDINNPARTGPGSNGSHLGDIGGPNEYASDWSLLRLATLLVEPKNQPTISVPDGMGGATLIDVPVEYLDSEYQIAYQPAMGSIYKAFAHRGGNDTNQADLPVVFYDFNTDGTAADQIVIDKRPTSASGIIDIATTSISEIRSIMLDVGGTSAGVAGQGTNGHPRAIVRGTDNRPLADATLMVDSADDMSEVLLNGAVDPWLSPSTVGDLPFMHAWMRDAMPAYSSTLEGDDNADVPTNQRVLALDVVERRHHGGFAAGFSGDRVRDDEHPWCVLLCRSDRSDGQRVAAEVHRVHRGMVVRRSRPNRWGRERGSTFLARLGHERFFALRRHSHRQPTGAARCPLYTE